MSEYHNPVSISTSVHVYDASIKVKRSAAQVAAPGVVIAIGTDDAYIFLSDERAAELRDKLNDFLEANPVPVAETDTAEGES